jgi:hypothetical protein
MVGLLAVFFMGSVLPTTSFAYTVDFQTPTIIPPSQIRDPYTPIPEVTFRHVWPNSVVGLVKNTFPGTSVCMDWGMPLGDQKFGTGRQPPAPPIPLGRAGHPIKALFTTPLTAPVTVRVYFQAIHDTLVRLRLFNGVTLLATGVNVTPGEASCNPLVDERGHVNITLTYAGPLTVTHAIMDSGLGNTFVIDNFRFGPPADQ